MSNIAPAWASKDCIFAACSATSLTPGVAEVPNLAAFIGAIGTLVFTLIVGASLIVLCDSGSRLGSFWVTDSLATVGGGVGASFEVVFMMERGGVLRVTFDGAAEALVEVKVGDVVGGRIVTGGSMEMGGKETLFTAGCDGGPRERFEAGSSEKETFFSMG